jgi:hypothetical protein
MRSLFSLDFLGASAQKSYTVAGAFIDWALERWGAATVRAWYGGGSIEALTGERWAAIDDEFRAWLRTQPMPPEATAYARAKFERPSVWARRCPHVVDAFDRDADKCNDEHRFARADALYQRALARDPLDYHALLARAKMAAQSEDATENARGRTGLEAIAGEAKAPRTFRDRAEEALADDDLVRGRLEDAARGYRDVAERTLDEDLARTLEVKELATEDPDARRVVVDLLLAEPGHSGDAWLGAFALGSAAGAPGVGVDWAAYLAGKNVAIHDRWERSAALLDRLFDGPNVRAPTRRIGREAIRQRAIDACVLRDHPALVRMRQAALSDSSPFAGGSGGRKESLLRLIARCDGD